jgi:hypothetical protein
MEEAENLRSPNIADRNRTPVRNFFQFLGAIELFRATHLWLHHDYL